MKLLFHDAGIESISILEIKALIVSKKENNIQPMAKKSPRAAIIIGQNIRRQRLNAGYTLTEIGQELGVSFQQIQKYETGRNHLPMEKLLALKAFYDVPFDVFFEGIDDPQTSIKSGINRYDGRGKIPMRNGDALKNPDRMCAPEHLLRSCQTIAPDHPGDPR